MHMRKKTQLRVRAPYWSADSRMKGMIAAGGQPLHVQLLVPNPGESNEETSNNVKKSQGADYGDAEQHRQTVSVFFHLSPPFKFSSPIMSDAPVGFQIEQEGVGHSSQEYNGLLFDDRPHAAHYPALRLKVSSHSS